MWDINVDDKQTVIKHGGKTWSFPNSKIVLTQDNKSDSVNVKLLGTRKTILTIPNKEINDLK